MSRAILLTFAFISFGLLATPAAGQFAEFLKLQPVIHARDEDRYEAMKSAPFIVMAEIESAKLVSNARDVEKPAGVGGPTAPTIPLHLAQISAKVLLTLRGTNLNTIEFYSWVWASGKHGGPRLFHPYPGSSHILFLRDDHGYLHTVGDYPSYDLEIPSRGVPTFISEWKSGSESRSDLFERLTTVRLGAELDTYDTSPADRWHTWSFDIHDLMGLTSPFFVASKLDSFCRNFANPFGQVAACEATAREFPGRCEAYRVAKKIATKGMEVSFYPDWAGDCEARMEDSIAFHRSRNWPLFLFGWSETPERRRLAMRLYASATDPEFHKAACDAAATMPEARDIPECPVPLTQ
jgi:hypothetical protein